MSAVDMDAPLQIKNATDNNTQIGDKGKGKPGKDSLRQSWADFEDSESLLSEPSTFPQPNHSPPPSYNPSCSSSLQNMVQGEAELPKPGRSKRPGKKERQRMNQAALYRQLDNPDMSTELGCDTATEILDKLHDMQGEYMSERFVMCMDALMTYKSML
jgi:hypothetical protein